MTRQAEESSFHGKLCSGAGNLFFLEDMDNFNPEEALCGTRREFGEHGGAVPSVERACTYTVMQSEHLSDIFQGKKGPSDEEGNYYVYGRHLNPTVSVLNRYMAALESTEAALSFSSGMSAITSCVLQLCPKGGHIISSSAVYGGTHAFFENLAPRLGITCHFINDSSDINEWMEAIERKTPNVVYTEVVANPTLVVSDIPSLSKLVHAIDGECSLVVDNTFTPCLVTPKLFGADVIVYSLTKYVNGCSDIIGGCICGTKAFISSLMDLQSGYYMLLGGTMDPRVAFDVIQRLPSLPLRMREHSVRAMQFAEYLDSHGVPIGYPGLKSDLGHSVLKKMLNRGYGYGGMVNIDCGTTNNAYRFMNELQAKGTGFIAVSLGFFDTLMSCSGSTTSSEMNVEDQLKAGIKPGLIRASIGFTGGRDQRMKELEEVCKNCQIFDSNEEIAKPKDSVIRLDSE